MVFPLDGFAERRPNSSHGISAHGPARIMRAPASGGRPCTWRYLMAGTRFRGALVTREPKPLNSPATTIEVHLAVNKTLHCSALALPDHRRYLPVIASDPCLCCAGLRDAPPFP